MAATAFLTMATASSLVAPVAADAMPPSETSAATSRIWVSPRACTLMFISSEHSDALGPCYRISRDHPYRSARHAFAINNGGERLAFRGLLGGHEPSRIEPAIGLPVIREPRDVPMVA